jgi:DnaK suppressor protein
MKQEDLDEIQKMIEAEILKTEKSVHEYRELTKPIAPENAIGRVSRMDAINNRSVTEAALRNAEKKLQGLKNILPKVADPEFGLCARCKQQIPIQRILLVPYSQFCVRCAR